MKTPHNTYKTKKRERNKIRAKRRDTKIFNFLITTILFRRNSCLYGQSVLFIHCFRCPKHIFIEQERHLIHTRTNYILQAPDIPFRYIVSGKTNECVPQFFMFSKKISVPQKHEKNENEVVWRVCLRWKCRSLSSTGLAEVLTCRFSLVTCGKEVPPRAPLA